MSEVKVFNDLKLKEENGQVLFDAETAAMKIGLTQEKNGLIYVRWERVNKLLGNSPRVGKGDYLTETQLYKLAIKAESEQAERFQEWVTSEVLPSIRKTGSYRAKPLSAMETLQLQTKAILETNERINTVEEDITNLKENVLLPAGQYSYLVSRINKRVNEVCKAFGKDISQKERGMLYRDINSGIKTIANVKTRTQLQIKHFNVVDNFITDWEPSTSTKTLIRQNNI